MAGRVAGTRKQCDVPGCDLLGRLYPKGWRCDVHGHVQPKPDSHRSATAVEQRGHVSSMQRNAVAALRVYVDPTVLREALEAAIRQHELAKV